MLAGYQKIRNPFFALLVSSKQLLVNSYLRGAVVVAKTWRSRGGNLAKLLINSSGGASFAAFPASPRTAFAPPSS